MRPFFSLLKAFLADEPSYREGSRVVLVRTQLVDARDVSNAEERYRNRAEAGLQMRSEGTARPEVDANGKPRNVFRPQVGTHGPGFIESLRYQLRRYLSLRLPLGSHDASAEKTAGAQEHQRMREPGLCTRLVDRDHCWPPGER